MKEEKYTKLLWSSWTVVTIAVAGNLYGLPHWFSVIAGMNLAIWASVSYGIFIKE